MSNLYDRLLKKEAKLAVIGLGYVGFPSRWPSRAG
jgi:UDP-N-acetyl-D-mannosaminuronate dehydrogenase